jgi:hypothetical protein
MRVLMNVFAAVGMFGAFICLVASGVWDALWSPASVMNPWDYGAKLQWAQRMGEAAAAGWPWLLGLVACLALAFVAVAWQERNSPPRGN